LTHNLDGLTPRTITEKDEEYKFNIVRTTLDKGPHIIGKADGAGDFFLYDEQDKAKGWFLHDQISMVIKPPEKYSYYWWKRKLRYFFDKLTFQRFAEKEEKC
jgi:hypothetical protein